MFEVNHEELATMIKHCYATRLPLFCWGTTGIGKSRVAKDIAKKEGLSFIDRRLSQMEPSDMLGIPTVDGDETAWKKPKWLPKEGKGILFLDEINLAPPSMQAAAYELVLDRRLGDYTLPDDWVVFAAGNRLEDKGHTFEIPAPLCNRFLHIELRVPKIDPDNIDTGWTGWAMKNELDMRVINFLIKNTSLLFKFDGTLKEKAFPTPRSWEMVSKLIREIDSNDLPMIQMLTSSAVGEGVAVTFSAFIKLGRKINLQDIFKHPEKVKELKDVDEKYALVNELTSYYQNKKDNKTFVGNVSGILNHLDPEFSIRLLIMCGKIGGQNFAKAIVNDDNSDKIIAKYGKYIYQ